MAYERLTGLIAAPFTPFHADGSLHLAQIPRLATALVANGVRGAFICGTTGEGASLTREEREVVAEAWVKAAPPELKIVVHVGHASLEEAKRLAVHAESIGAWGTGCLAPYFFKPGRTAELVQFCAEVARHAPGLPFYYYHIPSMTGVSLPVADFLRAAGPLIPNLAGAKYTFENLMEFFECSRLENSRYDLVFGRDEMLLAGWSMGAQGAIGSTYNFAAPIYSQVLDAAARGDLAAAREAQARANAVIQIFIRHGGLPAGKAIMAMIGQDCGPVRLPLRTLTAEEQSTLRRELEAASFFEFASRA